MGLHSCKAADPPPPPAKRPRPAWGAAAPPGKGGLTELAGLGLGLGLGLGPSAFAPPACGSSGTRASAEGVALSLGRPAVAGDQGLSQGLRQGH